jgi:hypothetical protein
MAASRQAYTPARASETWLAVGGAGVSGGVCGRGGGAMGSIGEKGVTVEIHERGIMTRVGVCTSGGGGERDQTVIIRCGRLDGPDLFNDDHQSALSVKRPTPI